MPGGEGISAEVLKQLIDPPCSMTGDEVEVAPVALLQGVLGEQLLPECACVFPGGRVAASLELTDPVLQPPNGTLGFSEPSFQAPGAGVFFDEVAAHLLESLGDPAELTEFRPVLPCIYQVFSALCGSQAPGVETKLAPGPGAFFFQDAGLQTQQDAWCWYIQPAAELSKLS